LYLIIYIYIKELAKFISILSSSNGRKDEIKSVKWEG